MRKHILYGNALPQGTVSIVHLLLYFFKSYWFYYFAVEAKINYAMTFDMGLHYIIYYIHTSTFQI